jgi:dTDP-glucose pyrophosphorylase
MKNWQTTLIRPDTTLRQALSAIDAAGRQMAIVVDESGRLVGTLSDGDIRRWLIGGGTIDQLAGEVCNRQPTTAPRTASPTELMAMMRARGVHQMPVVDETGHVVGLSTVDDFLQYPDREELVVVMVGGLGSRMGALTQATPKPMLPVGDKPVLQVIVEQFRQQGFRNFCFAINYLGDQIVSHFGDGSRFDVRIDYLREEKRMGTAGALSLLPPGITTPIVVANGDLLLREDFSRALDRHIEAEADATVMVRDYQMQVPFGVISETDGMIREIVEKPVHTFKVNAGVYFLNPCVLPLVPANSFYDLPDLFNTCVSAGMHTAAHSVTGYWIDIGQVADYERAQREYDEAFR